jgi:hypothetical protein
VVQPIINIEPGLKSHRKSDTSMGFESWLNIGVQVGLRGTTDYKLQKDLIVRLSVAVSASELWFLKFDEE